MQDHHEPTDFSFLKKKQRISKIKTRVIFLTYVCAKWYPGTYKNNKN